MLPQQRVPRRTVSKMPVPLINKASVRFSLCTWNASRTRLLDPEEIAEKTLLVPPERMQERFAELNTDFLVGRYGDIVGGVPHVPLGRIQERVVDPTADFPVPRHGEDADQDADSLVPVTSQEIATWLNVQ